MHESLLRRIAEIEKELEYLYGELDSSDYTHYARHTQTSNKILKLSEELMSLKNGLELIA